MYREHILYELTFPCVGVCLCGVCVCPCVPRSAQAQLRRLDRAAGKQGRKCLRERLSLQSTPSASSHAAPAPVGHLPKTHPIPRPIGSLPSDTASTGTPQPTQPVCPRCARSSGSIGAPSAAHPVQR